MHNYQLENFPHSTVQAISARNPQIWAKICSKKNKSFKMGILRAY